MSLFNLNPKEFPKELFGREKELDELVRLVKAGIEYQVGFAYAPNNWYSGLFDDPRQMALVNASKKSLSKSP